MRTPDGSRAYIVSSDKNPESYRNALLTGAYGIVTGNESIQVSTSNLISVEEIDGNAVIGTHEDEDFRKRELLA